ncbi:MAG: leucine-rich repeat domain-containing protein [Oscillospiraceae bacterium]|nr:leucine-rich repeat domain-containing protein [Oscillospiraceae bacterium]
MRCKYCNTELNNNESVCSNCGKSVVQIGSNVENIDEVKVALKDIYDTHGAELLHDKKRFTGLLNDYMPDFEKERRLIRNVISNGVVTEMLKEPDQKLAIIKAREYMLNDMFLSSYAAEFVLECFTYMLGWNFTPEKTEAETPEASQPAGTQQRAHAPKPQKEKEKEPVKETKQYKPKPFKAFDAIKYKLAGNIKIAEGYTAINSFAFDGYGFMKTLRLPESLIAIGEYAFSDCKRLRSIEMPSSIRSIQKAAFSSCLALESIDIPMGVDAIHEGTFSFCQSLAKVTIPESVSSIGDEAFEGCDSLETLYVPASVKFIGANVFAFCKNITVLCEENSYVHRFCVQNGIRFELTFK